MAAHFDSIAVTPVVDSIGVGVSYVALRRLIFAPFGIVFANRPIEVVENEIFIDCVIHLRDTNTRAEGETVRGLRDLHIDVADWLPIHINYRYLSVPFTYLFDSGVGVAFPVGFSRRTSKKQA